MYRKQQDTTTPAWEGNYTLATEKMEIEKKLEILV